MSTKHDMLTEADMYRFQMNPTIFDWIREQVGLRGRAAEPFRVLDWGCGRGRAVARLRHEGIEAFGIDVDRVVLENGYGLLRARGLNPERLLRHIDEAKAFEDGTFDVIFSEETLEHVADLAMVAHNTFRLLRPGGIALHSFPGSRWLIEPHVSMPLVHWLPTGRARQRLLLLCLLFRFGPRPPWPETLGASLWQCLSVYDRYLAEKTHYRPRRQVMDTFASAGFVGRWLDVSNSEGWRRLLPPSLRDEGFPAAHLLLHLTKPGTAATC